MQRALRSLDKFDLIAVLSSSLPEADVRKVSVTEVHSDA